MMKKLFYSLLAIGLASSIVSCSKMTSLSLSSKSYQQGYTLAPPSFHVHNTSSFYPAPADKEMYNDAVEQGLEKDRKGYPTYTKLNERHRYVRTTSYSHMENEPGAPGRKNAAGTILLYGDNVRSAAADWSRYPLGTKFKIKGLPYTYVVDDYGSGLVGTNTIDIFHPTLRSMRRWGTRPAEIHVVQWGSFQRSAKMLKGRRKYWHCKQMYTDIMNNYRYTFASENPENKRNAS